MVVISFFDGPSTCRLALESADIKITKYFCSEIDKYATSVSQYNYSDNIHIGDIEKVSYMDGVLYTENGNFDLPHVDIVCGGFPCQGFSRVGNKLNFKDPRSQLFFTMMDIVKAINPPFFFFENVKMDDYAQRVINDHIGVFPVHLNSEIISAQMRPRLYWSNIKIEKKGLWSDVYTKAPFFPKCDLTIIDILQDESEVDQKYYIKNPKANFKGLDILAKSRTLRASGHQSQSNKHNFDLISVKCDKKGNIKANQYKANCLTCGGNSGGNHSDMDLIATCDYRHDEGYRVKKHLKTGTLTARDREDESCGQFLIYNWKLRRYTPIECEALQTWPRDFTKYGLFKGVKKIISDSKRYKMTGNGWTMEVAKAFFEMLPEKYKV